ncbi:hypothetical protein PORY_000633 [Pneumocystis oryctolagi]|uniref:Uncharacterized protein n=1 Tax=Pneumocystis oryctolagi TaxID=42067 RepID=A0ACB7CFK2_9ASCO|nr:hypothetical protein PORY_000633 [Pneumocystis oryctolagi]
MAQVLENTESYENVIHEDDVPLLGYKKHTTELNIFLRRFRFRKNVSFSVKKLVISCTMILVTIFSLFLISPYFAEKYILNAFDVTINRVDLKNVTEDGIKMQVNGFVVVDSSKINFTIARSLWRLSTGILKKMIIYPSDINLMFPYYTKEKVAVVALPRFEMYIQDYHRTNFDELISINIYNIAFLASVFKTYFEGGLQNVSVSGKGIFYLKSFFLPIFRVYIDKTLIIRERSGIDGLEARVQLSVRVNVSISAVFPYLMWYASVPSCNQIKYIKVAEIKNYFYYDESENRLKIIFLFHILPFSDELLEVCHNTGVSLLNKLLSEYLSGKSSKIYIEGHIFELYSESSNPLWLSQLLERIKVSISLPGLQKNDFLRSVRINRISLEYEREKSLKTYISFPGFVYDVIAKIEFPSFFDFYINITCIRSNLSFFDNGTVFSSLVQDDCVPSSSTKLSSMLLVETKVNYKYFRIFNLTKFDEILKKSIFQKSRSFVVYAKGNVLVRKHNDSSFPLSKDTFSVLNRIWSGNSSQKSLKRKVSEYEETQCTSLISSFNSDHKKPRITCHERSFPVIRLLEHLDSSSLLDIIQSLVDRHPTLLSEVIGLSSRPNLSSVISILNNMEEQVRRSFPYGSDSMGEYAYNRIRPVLQTLMDALLEYTCIFLPPYESNKGLTLTFLDHITTMIHRFPEWNNPEHNYAKEKLYDEISNAWASVILSIGKDGWCGINGYEWIRKLIKHNEIAKGRLKSAMDVVQNELKMFLPEKGRSDVCFSGNNRVGFDFASCYQI